MLTYPFMNLDISFSGPLERLYNFSEDEAMPVISRMAIKAVAINSRAREALIKVAASLLNDLAVINKTVQLRKFPADTSKTGRHPKELEGFRGAMLLSQMLVVRQATSFRTLLRPAGALMKVLPRRLLRRMMIFRFKNEVFQRNS